LEREHGKLIYSFDIRVPGKPGIEEVQVSAISLDLPAGHLGEGGRASQFHAHLGRRGQIPLRARVGGNRRCDRNPESYGQRERNNLQL
jgi:hypothetical protein